MYQTLLNKAALFLPHLASGIVIFMIFWLLGLTIKKTIIKVTAKSYPGRKQVFALIAKLTNITFLVFGTITALSNMSINVTALIAGLGLTSFGLGFALKDAISNILSGILVLIYRPFRINDLIKIGDITGTVTNIDLRYITIQAEDKKVLIPNANLFNTAITILNKE